MDSQNITTQQAYAAMLAFLEDYYERTNSDDIGALLGDLQMDENNVPFDPAVVNDWQIAINKVRQ